MIEKSHENNLLLFDCKRFKLYSNLVSLSIDVTQGDLKMKRAGLREMLR